MMMNANEPRRVMNASTATNSARGNVLFCGSDQCLKVQGDKALDSPVEGPRNMIKKLK
jgi:hypothetical protein